MVALVFLLRAMSLLAFVGPMSLGIRGRRARPEARAVERGRDRAPVAANFAAFGVFVPSLFAFAGRSDGVVPLVLASTGTLLAFAGTALVQRARNHLGAAWSFVPKADQGIGLVTTGPYRLVRHPIYVGLACLAFGEAVAFANWPAVLVVLLGIIPTFVRRARAEESLLRKTFGASYGDYQRGTGMLIPRLVGRTRDRADNGTDL
jgi:protein-S-isoprenylcysteine O-methyltransferase Ste14